MSTCAEKEPEKLTSGYSFEWTRSVSGKPTTDHTLRYVFRKLSGKGDPVTVDATGDGVEKYKVTLTPAVSSQLKAETYSLVGYIFDDATAGATVKEIVFDGSVTVLPDPQAAAGEDRRGFARRMVDALRKAMEQLATGGLSSVSVNGKQYTRRNLAEVRQELARFEAMLMAEEAAQRIKDGCTNPNNIYVRFT